MSKVYDTIIIWAGPAWIWTWKKLQELGIDYLILEKDKVGSSFLNWPDYTRFITPSFPSNAFLQTDLNSLDANSSAWVITEKEHMSWKDFASYLRWFTGFHRMNIKEDTQVSSIEKKGDLFHVHTSDYTYTTKFICCATGEFSFPWYGDIEWHEHSLHSSEFKNASMYADSTWVVPVIWWYESAIDAAYSLTQSGREVHIFSWGAIDDEDTTDPSRRLSLYSVERYKQMKESGLLRVIPVSIERISYSDGSYTLFWGGEEYVFENRPIAATWFESKIKVLWDLVSYNTDWFALLNSVDELEKTPNIFIVWPGVRHRDLIFCFIYKFRLRFWVVALEIAKRLEKNIDYSYTKESWEKQWFFLDDFSCCWDECVC